MLRRSLLRSSECQNFKFTYQELLKLKEAIYKLGVSIVIIEILHSPSAKKINSILYRISQGYE
jgi:hypothetical protein